VQLHAVLVTDGPTNMLENVNFNRSVPSSRLTRFESVTVSSLKHCIKAARTT
jgi:hypothetical protein